MIQIPCPWCGPRNEEEFSYGGSAEANMPRLDDQASFADWHAYVHLRDNPKGPHREYWHHTSGCERWLLVCRDTRDNTILECGDASEVSDDVSGDDT